MGAGVGLDGILAANVAKKVLLTDHNDIVLDLINKNIELNPKTKLIINLL